MDFTYSGDPSQSLLDAVRFYAQDTNPADPFLSDGEIEFLITEWVHVTSNPIFVAAVVCDTIAAKFAREISFSADGVSIGASDLQEKYERLAESLRGQYASHDISGAPDFGGIMVGTELDSSIKPLIFATEMHDNVAAGQQNYGGTYNAAEIPEIIGFP